MMKFLAFSALTFVACALFFPVTQGVAFHINTLAVTWALVCAFFAGVAGWKWVK